MKVKYDVLLSKVAFNGINSRPYAQQQYSDLESTHSAATADYRRTAAAAAAESTAANNLAHSEIDRLRGQLAEAERRATYAASPSAQSEAAQASAQSNALAMYREKLGPAPSVGRCKLNPS